MSWKLVKTLPACFSKHRLQTFNLLLLSHFLTDNKLANNLKTVTPEISFKTYLPPGHNKKNIILKPLLKRNLKKTINSNQGIIFDGENNPKLDHLIPAYFSETKFEYVKSIMEILRRTNLIKWNYLGELTSPIPGYKILDIIKNFSDSRNKLPEGWSDKMKLDYLTIFKYMNIPSLMIMNKRLKRMMENSTNWDSGIKSEEVKPWVKY